MARAFLAFAVFVTLSLTTTPGEATDAERQTLAEAARQVRAAKLREAALRSIDGSVAYLEQRLSSPEEQALEMLSDPARYRSAAESETLLRERERERLTTAFREQLAVFARHHADGGGDDLPPTWVDDVMSREEGRVGETIDGLMDRFAERFAQARQDALKLQRADLDDVVHPEQGEIEALVGSAKEFAHLPREETAARVGSPNAQALIDEYTERIASGHPLFEENEQSLRLRVERAIADSLVLLWRQLRLVARTGPEDGLERTQITRRIVDDLEELAAEAESVSGTHYGVFASAEAYAAERGEELEHLAFRNYVRRELNHASGCPALPAARVLEEIGSSFDDVPARRTDHEQGLAQRLRPEVEEELLNEYTKPIGDAEARARLRERLAETVGVEATRAGFKRCLADPVEKRRGELAEAELTARLPSVADRSFEFSDQALSRLESSPLDESWLGELPAADGLRMEEARQAYEARRRELQREARNAVWQQMSLTRAPERKASFVERIVKDDDRSDERRKHWQQEYEASVLAAWEEARQGVLLKDASGTPYHPEKYDRVFGLVSDIIDEIITLEFGRTGTPAATVTAAVASEGSPTQPVTAEQTPMPESAGEPVSAPPASSEEPARPQSAREPSRPTPEATPKTVVLTARPKPAPRPSHSSSPSSPESVPCDEQIEQCALASEVCYDALTSCKLNPSSCDSGIARCHAQLDTCESRP